MQLMSTAVSALAQVLLLGGVPLFGYRIWQRWRRRWTFSETAQRAGLQLGRRRYLVYSIEDVLCCVECLNQPWQIGTRWA
jgi:hypothetical protein